jgi:hypothetical protein
MEIPLLIRNHRIKRIGPRSALKSNTYLTDESRLYRCLGWDGSLVLLEDCATLEAFAYPAEELAATDMRLVKPAR